LSRRLFFDRKFRNTNYWLRISSSEIEIDNFKYI
jgi:hypothetical protein